MRGFEALERLVKDLVNALGGRECFFYATVDFAAVSVDIEKRGGANGKCQNAWGIIALMRAPDLEIAQAQRINHFRRTGYKGDDSHSPNIALAIFGCGLLIQQFFELLRLAVGFAQQGNIQEADLELEFGNDVHNPLYRAYVTRSIDA